MQLSENSNDDFLFIDDSDEDEVLNESHGNAWKVLIVDDDPEIHSVTQLALSDLYVLGHRLEYVHAYSGKEACELLKEHEDIVLVLLDVVMESDDAGLNVVKYLRETLGRADIRIVLRTGQPGYAPEESVIKDYDINDYKTKTELTRRKLVTTVYAAIRSYQQISTVTKSREGLENIINSAARLLELQSVYDYAEGVLKQLNSLCPISRSVFCARGQGIVKNVDDLSLYVVGQQGFSSVLVDQKLAFLNDDVEQSKINQCFSQKSHDYQGKSVCLYLSSGGYRAVIYLELVDTLSELEQQLIEVFLANVSIGYENVHLFQKLRNAAYKDWLTELPNRLDFVNLLDDFGANASDDHLAALIDISHFSDINDGLGQDIGNQLLMAVSSRLRQALGDNCQIARVGADIFGVIGTKERINADTLNALFVEPFAAGEHNLPINACFGVCNKTDAAKHGVNILNQINIALNLAKKNHQEHIVFYQKEMEDKTLWRLGMIRQLRTDFAEKRLSVWYQPQLDLATGKVTGAEALLRWQTRDGEFISPAVFIPLAEYSGLIIDIGEWVLSEACQQIKRLEQQGFNDISVSVNVSIPQFRRAGYAETVIDTIKQYQVSPQKLELEITENILMDDPQVVIDALNKIKSQGINIALDDFGTGYSSLNYLQKLPLDRLKVDRSFVSDITEKEQAHFANTIITLGKQMKLNVIAEGIETAEQEAELIAQGCDEVQGFYYAKPMPEEDFIKFLAEKN